MNVNTMRRVDRFVGVPLCWMLGLFHLVKTHRKKYNSLNGVEKILIIKFFGMGSVLLSSSALSAIKVSFPQAQISYLSFEVNRELLERISNVDEILVLRTNSINHFVADTVKVLRIIWKREFEIVFDFEFFSKFSTLISGLTFAPVRVGFALPTAWRSLLLTHQVPLSKNKHVTESFCEQVFSITGIKQPVHTISVRTNSEDVESLKNKVSINGKSKLVINVNAGETFLERRWQPEKFSALVSYLSMKEESEFFFIGTVRERDYVQNVIEKTNCKERCYNLAGKLTIPELVSLLQLSDLLISNDSGPLHIATAVGTPVVALYGPESPSFYGPCVENAQIIYKAIPCSPCMNVYTAKTFRCPYNARCMQSIEVEEVIHAAEQIFALI